MIKVEVIDSYRSGWGEGPLWHRGKLSYVDITRHRIVQYNPNTKVDEESHSFVELDQEIGFVVPTKSDQWIWGGVEGLYLCDENFSQHQLIHEVEKERVENRFNDGKVSPQGTLFAGTISCKKITGNANLYCLKSHSNQTGRFSSELSIAYGSVTNSNGLCWSPDKLHFYYIDSPSKEIKVFSWNDDEMVNHLEKIISVSHIDATPDGMCIDNLGHLWVAFCHGGLVINFDSTNGKEIRRIEIPCLETTSCAFGGEQGNDLYITTGIHKSIKEDLGGFLFVAKGLDVHAPSAIAFGE